MLVVKNSLISTECRLIDPVLLVHPLHLSFVQPDIRVVDESLTQQIGMHYTWHLSRIAVRKTRLAKCPSFMQILSVLSEQLQGRCKKERDDYSKKESFLHEFLFLSMNQYFL